MKAYTPPQIIETLAQYFDLSVAELAQQSGYERAQSFYDVMNGKTKNISPKMAENIILRFPEIRRSWLLTGEGDMLNPINTTNINNVKKIKGNVVTGNYNKIPSEKRHENPKVLESDIANYKKGVPYYDIDFINGFDNVEEIRHNNPEYLINYPPANNCDYWVNATGDSMIGVINHGDRIAIKEVDKEWFPLGEVYAIVTTNGHRMIKRVSKSPDKNCYRLISANPNKEEYPDQDIPKKLIKHIFKVTTAIKIIN